MTPRFNNIIGTLPLALWYLWGLWQQAPVLFQNYYQLSKSGHIDVLAWLGVLSQIVSILFSCFLILLLIARETPRAQARGVIPYAATYVGTFAVATFYFLPVAHHSPLFLAVALLCLVIGLCSSLYAVMHLGKSFAVLPSARTLVISGPYRLIRHPLYLFEEIAVVGIMLQFLQPWSLCIFVIHLCAQLVRMHYEEKILSETFPEYREYTARTKRLIPGVY